MSNNQEKLGEREFSARKINEKVGKGERERERETARHKQIKWKEACPEMKDMTVCSETDGIIGRYVMNNSSEISACVLVLVTVTHGKQWCDRDPSVARVLNLTLTYSPISLFRWQMYAAQSMRNKWTSVLGTDLVEDNDEDQDSLKVSCCGDRRGHENCVAECLLNDCPGERPPPLFRDPIFLPEDTAK